MRASLLPIGVSARRARGRSLAAPPVAGHHPERRIQAWTINLQGIRRQGWYQCISGELMISVVIDFLKDSCPPTAFMGSRRPAEPDRRGLRDRRQRAGERSWAPNFRDPR